MVATPTSAQGHLLVSLPDCSAFRLAAGAATPLVEGATLTLSSVELDGDAWLVLALGGELELPVAASTLVSRQGETSYLIGAPTGEEGFYRIDLPTRGAAPEERELLESCLSSWSAFASAQNVQHKNRLVLVDEPTGQIIGDLSNDIREDMGVSKTGDASITDPSDTSNKDPVIVDISPSGAVRVSPLRQMAANHGQSGSSIINAAEYVSRGILFAADRLSTSMESGARNFVSKRPATESPLVFSPVAKSGVKGVHAFTDQVVVVSGRTVEVVSRFASRIGNGIGKTLGTQSTPDGKPPSGWKGTLNKSLVAFNTLADSVEASAKHVASTGTQAATSVAGHRFGPDAAETVQRIGGVGTNITLVYIDARGVSRKALVKSVGSAAFKAKMTDGREVILQQDPPDMLHPAAPYSGKSSPASTSRPPSPLPPSSLSAKHFISNI